MFCPVVEPTPSLLATFVAEHLHRRPEWIGAPLQAANVLTSFGEPSDDELDEMGPARLDERLSQLEKGVAGADARVAWVRKYSYPQTDLLIEIGTVDAYGKLYRATKSAFDRSPVPQEWTAPTIPRRIMERISIGNPMLASEMMTEPVLAVEVID